MISRRNFLKLAGLSTFAVGAGYTTGKLIRNSKPVHYSIHGFIPDDEQVINQIVSAFKHKIKSNSNPIVYANSKFGELISIADSKMQNENYGNNGTVTYSLKKLDKTIDADLIVGDAKNSIYSLDDFSEVLANLRAKLKGTKANNAFTAAYDETEFVSSLFKNNRREVVIENEKGLVDKITFSKNYKGIVVDGPQGKTEIEIINGIVRVHKSTCRHEICKQSAAFEVGNIIACAPNKVLVRIV